MLTRLSKAPFPSLGGKSPASPLLWSRPRFFVGVHHPHLARHLDPCMVSVNVLLRRRSDFQVGEWMLDSGAFSRLTSGTGHLPLPVYVAQVHRWARCGRLVAAVCQDWMCEPFVLERTGLTVAEHQRRTLENYRALTPLLAPTYCMPVVQGYTAQEYCTHLDAYGALLAPQAWVGLGSVCKRNATAPALEAILRAVHRERPDLRWHGFGLKRTALQSAVVDELLTSCDSMAWSYAARRAGRNANSVQEALRYAAALEAMPVQLGLWPLADLPTTSEVFRC